MTRRKRRLLLALMCLASLPVVGGLARRPAASGRGGPIEPLAFVLPSTNPVEVASTDDAATLPARSGLRMKNPTRLRLASYNVHSCRDLNSVYHPELTAAAIEGADLASLNECRGSGPWWNADAAELGERLHMRSVFFPIETLFGHPWFGNAVLTKVPVTSWETTSLPHGFRMSYRQMNHLVVPFGDGALNVIMVHMGKKSDRARQFKIVADAFLNLPEPAVLMGDMNTRLDDPLIQDLLARGAVDVVGTHATCDPARVDFIFTRGVKCTDAGLTENHASDHPLAWAEIEAK